MTPSLPALADYEAFHAWRADQSRWLPVASDVAHGHGLKATSPHVFATGTNLVVGLGDDLILKLFPPMLRGQFVSERASLRQLRGQLSLPIPEILFEGERDGWPYLIVTRLHGVVGSEVWPGLPEDQKERVLAQIGASIAEVQRAPLGELASIEPQWADFIPKQIEGCRARHTRLGLPPKFLAGFDDILRDAATLIPLDKPPVILTGEYIPENFLLSRDGNGWRLSGLFDFGDVMTGFGEYDLLGPSAFMTAGVRRRVRSLFEGFGYSSADIHPAMKRRLMALMLLHQHSDPIRHIKIEGWQEKAGDLVELQDLVWPT
ncbi:aminoglycoside 3'-phosphotransferase/choline kinase family protein [Bradyrhizobium sp. AUGA SZCCT0169]|uniref:aminoglycoside phosphotransferase family protein n=1 Tax=Bradyrhizobium sp. AUGA SZCCT0169 TaxID=2807663 RepID=UPI001BACEAED|nr:aminoglycoside 3'-phosphotransferase/choline kinase family protein [Bradyrhizobium sp. AUGA SZCCT0169]MBR1248500.1 aminoglycoside 3'-phosphotransferase/choline kinase family protein [Bradyrhizobium sp. AUGA SZCCT0169]